MCAFNLGGGWLVIFQGASSEGSYGCHAITNGTSELNGAYFFFCVTKLEEDREPMLHQTADSILFFLSPEPKMMPQPRWSISGPAKNRTINGIVLRSTMF